MPTLEATGLLSRLCSPVISGICLCCFCWSACLHRGRSRQTGFCGCRGCQSGRWHLDGRHARRPAATLCHAIAPACWWWSLPPAARSSCLCFGFKEAILACFFFEARPIPSFEWSGAPWWSRNLDGKSLAAWNLITTMMILAFSADILNYAAFGVIAPTCLDCILLIVKVEVLFLHGFQQGSR